MKKAIAFLMAAGMTLALGASAFAEAAPTRIALLLPYIGDQYSFDVTARGDVYKRQAPVLYVHGNHDDKYEQVPPEGCTCIEDQIFVYEGIRILGLGGSMRYRPGTNQYTEREMKKRVSKLWFPLLRRGGFDILVTHSPAYQLGDGRDLPHQGFRTFVDLMDKYHPRYRCV